MVVDAGIVLFLTALATAVAGMAVATVAYRGYRENDSETMLLLAIGIVCIAVFPFLITYGGAPLAALSDAVTLLGVLAANIAGLLAILYSLEGT